MIGRILRKSLNLSRCRQDSSFNEMVTEIRKPNEKPPCKISVVGAGQVGISICSFLLLRNLTKHLVIFDVRHDWVKAEVLDLLHASCWLGNPRIEPSGDGSHTKDSDIVIITAGARPTGEDRSRLLVMHKTVDILKSFVSKLVQLSPKAVFLVVSNPADVMTYAVQRLGKLERHRCFTSGCHLDSARFRFLIAKRLGMPTTDVLGYVIGEHGDSAVPVWSSVSVAGIPLSKVIKNLGTDKDEENWNEISEEVKTGGSAVSLTKGYTNWAVALTVVDVVEALQENSGRVLCVGTDMQGICGIEDNVVMSMPCKITSNGVSHVLQLPLTEDEQEKLLKSAEILREAQCSLQL